MKKTIDISLGGMLFHLDETAYYKLKKYLNAVKASLQHQEDVEEVMNEIEARIAELFVDKQAHPKEVINDQYIDEVVAVMGQPEDYEEVAEETTTSGNHYRVKKGLFRDLEKSIFGGISSGFAHYMGIDITIMRLVFVVLLFITHGSFGLVYLLLWIVIPRAKTASDKLRMKGERINVDSIAGQVSTEEGGAKKKINFGERVEHSTHEIGNVIIRILGLFIAFTTGIVLFSLLVSALSLSPMSDMHLFLYDTSFYQGLNIPFGWLNILAFIIVGFPIGLLFLLGVKMLFSNTKAISKNVFIVGGTIWFLSLVFLIVKTTSLLAHKNESARVITEESVIPFATDTLVMTTDRHLLSKKKAFFTNHSIVYNFKPSEDSTFHYYIEKVSEGIDMDEARIKASNIRFVYKIDSVKHKIIFSRRLQYPAKDFVQDHDVEITVFIPQGKFVRLSNRINAYTDIFCKNPAVLENKNGHIVCVSNENDAFHNNTDENTEVLQINGQNVNVKITEDGLDIYSDGDEKGHAHIKVDENGINIDANDDKDAVKVSINEKGVSINKNKQSKK